MEITIDELKQNLNIEKKWNGDNQYLQSLLDAAKVVVEKHICDSIDGITSEEQLPLAHAIKLLVGTWYMNRESLSNLQTANHSYEYILSLYKNYGG
jgi:DNA packaging protein, QLRG family|nr:MAG TPA: head tail connector [Caudoviricetes sp.]